MPIAIQTGLSPSVSGILNIFQKLVQTNSKWKRSKLLALCDRNHRWMVHWLRRNIPYFLWCLENVIECIRIIMNDSVYQFNVHRVFAMCGLHNSTDGLKQVLLIFKSEPNECLYQDEWLLVKLCFESKTISCLNKIYIFIYVHGW